MISKIKYPKIDTNGRSKNKGRLRLNTIKRLKITINSIKYKIMTGSLLIM